MYNFIFSYLPKDCLFQSYAGKYIPAIAYRIHIENPTAKLKINLKGIAIGDGLCDPLTMMPVYADYIFHIGLFDEAERDYFQSQMDKAVVFIQQKEWMEAFKIFDALLLGDVTSEPSFFNNVTGMTYYFNYLHAQAPPEFEYFLKYIADPSVRKSMHVGNLTYNSGEKVEMHLMNDIMQSVKPWVAVLLDNYKALLYSGQLDIIVAAPLTEAFLMTVQWSGQGKYKQAPKLIWKVNETDTEVAGYVRQVNSFYQVIVRNSGHILPYDQPERAYDMIQRFVEDRSF
ncbi:hypothetical protein ScPMuIL_015066 [Solemya velum]